MIAVLILGQAEGFTPDCPDQDVIDLVFCDSYRLVSNGFGLMNLVDTSGGLCRILQGAAASV